ncbi:hypothetical protein ACH50O_12770 [Methylomonas sp. 2BW1-5-20]|uniref:hypothetical protein n=1 Tax=Methylomonas sp. 2BW1-5-20 TaxID=3376686 RepID=UPI0040530E65
MKHLEPLPKSASQSLGKPKPAVSSSMSKFKLFMAGMLLVAGLGYGMTAIWGTVSSDSVSKAEQATLVAEFAKLKSIDVEPVSVQDTDTALDSMQLQPPQRQQLQTALLNRSTPLATAMPRSQVSETGLVWITLWDFAAADGDVVHVSSAGFEMDIVLQKSQTRIAVPVDSSKTVKISGVHDGGGGITLGVKNGAGMVSLPVLQTAQTLTVPVSF